MSFGSQVWAARQRGQERFEARLTRQRALKDLGAALLSCLFAAIFAWMLATGATPWLHFLVLFFGLLGVLVALATAYQYFGPEPALVLDAEGLRHALLGQVRWREVAAMDMTVMRGREEPVPFLAICLAPGVRMQGGAPWLRWQSPSNLRIALRGLDRPPDEIDAVAKAFRDQSQPPRLEFWVPGMGAGLVAAMCDSQCVRSELERLSFSTPPTSHENAELERLVSQLGALTERQRIAGEADLRRQRRRMRRQLAIAVAAVLLLLLAQLKR